MLEWVGYMVVVMVGVVIDLVIDHHPRCQILHHWRVDVMDSNDGCFVMVWD